MLRQAFVLPFSPLWVVPPLCLQLGGLLSPLTLGGTLPLGGGSSASLASKDGAAAATRLARLRCSAGPGISTNTLLGGTWTPLTIWNTGAMSFIW